MFPSPGLTNRNQGAFLPPDDLTRRYFLEDWELGGVDYQDGSEGLLYQVWRCYKSESGDITIEPQTSGTTVIFLNAPEARELSFAFDQNMNPAVAWQADGVLYYRWYDTSISTFVTSEFDGRSPFVTMDDKRAYATRSALNDIILFYFRGATLYYRLQRDRYDTEYTITTFVGPRVWIRRCGMGRNGRVQLEFLGTDAKLA